MTAVKDPVTRPGSDAGRTLCAAAMTLLVTDGIAALDPDLVDREAGLPPGTCASYYHSPSELLAAMLEREAATFSAALDAIQAEHRDDPAAAVVGWMAYLVESGAARALWALMYDAGTRRGATMYFDALLVGWEREIMSRFGLTTRQLLIAWPMIEGWAMHTVLRAAPMPDLNLLREHVRALLERSA
jgi:DNA-binding transcriptional regulator YbjK